MSYQERFIDLDIKGSYCFLDLTEINKLFIEADKEIAHWKEKFAIKSLATSILMQGDKDELD